MDGYISWRLGSEGLCVADMVPKIPVFVEGLAEVDQNKKKLLVGRKESWGMVLTGADVGAKQIGVIVEGVKRSNKLLPLFSLLKQRAKFCGYILLK